MNWFERRRFNRALETIHSGTELTGTELLNLVRPRDQDQLFLQMSYLLSKGQIDVRYEAIVEGILVETQTSFLDFSPSIDPFNDVEVVYISKG